MASSWTVTGKNSSAYASKCVAPGLNFNSLFQIFLSFLSESLDKSLLFSPMCLVQITMLQQSGESHSHSTDQPVFILGDFNTFDLSEYLQFLQRSVLVTLPPLLIFALGTSQMPKTLFANLPRVIRPQCYSPSPQVC